MENNTIYDKATGIVIDTIGYGCGALIDTIGYGCGAFIVGASNDLTIKSLAGITSVILAYNSFKKMKDIWRLLDQDKISRLEENLV